MASSYYGWHTKTLLTVRDNLEARVTDPHLDEFQDTVIGKHLFDSYWQQLFSMEKELCSRLSIKLPGYLK